MFPPDRQPDTAVRQGIRVWPVTALPVSQERIRFMAAIASCAHKEHSLRSLEAPGATGKSGCNQATTLYSCEGYAKLAHPLYNDQFALQPLKA